MLHEAERNKYLFAPVLQEYWPAKQSHSFYMDTMFSSKYEPFYRMEIPRTFKKRNVYSASIVWQKKSMKPDRKKKANEKNLCLTFSHPIKFYSGIIYDVFNWKLLTSGWTTESSIRRNRDRRKSVSDYHETFYFVHIHSLEILERTTRMNSITRSNTRAVGGRNGDSVKAS